MCSRKRRHFSLPSRLPFLQSPAHRGEFKQNRLYALEAGFRLSLSEMATGCVNQIRSTNDLRCWLVGLFIFGVVRGRRSDVMLSILQVNRYVETLASLEAGNGDNASILAYCTVLYRSRCFRCRISPPDKYVSPDASRVRSGRSLRRDALILGLCAITAVCYTSSPRYVKNQNRV